LFQAVICLFQAVITKTGAGLLDNFQFWV